MIQCSVYPDEPEVCVSMIVQLGVVGRKGRSQFRIGAEVVGWYAAHGHAVQGESLFVSWELLGRRTSWTSVGFVGASWTITQHTGWLGGGWRPLSGCLVTRGSYGWTNGHSSSGTLSSCGTRHRMGLVTGYWSAVLAIVMIILRWCD